MIRDDAPASYQARLAIISADPEPRVTAPNMASPTLARDPSPSPQSLDTDDIFGDASPSLLPREPHTDRLDVDAHGLEMSEIPSIRRVHETAGYRDGVTASKANFMQEGFDEGFALGAELGIRVGWIIGTLEGCIRSFGKDLPREAKENTAEKGLSALELTKLLSTANDELKIEVLLGSDWITKEGLWNWTVPGQEEKGGEENITFKEVAAAHRTILKWSNILADISTRMDGNISFVEPRLEDQS